MSFLDKDSSASGRERKGDSGGLHGRLDGLLGRFADADRAGVAGGPSRVSGTSGVEDARGMGAEGAGKTGELPAVGGPDAAEMGELPAVDAAGAAKTGELPVAGGLGAADADETGELPAVRADAGTTAEFLRVAPAEAADGSAVEGAADSADAGESAAGDADDAPVPGVLIFRPKGQAEEPVAGSSPVSFVPAGPAATSDDSAAETTAFEPVARRRPGSFGAGKGGSGNGGDDGTGDSRLHAALSGRGARIVLRVAGAALGVVVLMGGGFALGARFGADVVDAVFPSVAANRPQEQLPAADLTDGYEGALSRRVAAAAADVEAGALMSPSLDEATAGAIGGVLASAGDVDAAYLTQEEYERYQRLAAGSNVGIGASFVDGERGPVVALVSQGSPAEEAGLRPGDVIVAVNGDRDDLPSAAGLADLLAGEAGIQVELTWVRPPVNAGEVAVSPGAGDDAAATPDDGNAAAASDGGAAAGAGEPEDAVAADGIAHHSDADGDATDGEGDGPEGAAAGNAAAGEPTQDGAQAGAASEVAPVETTATLRLTEGATAPLVSGHLEGSTGVLTLLRFAPGVADELAAALSDLLESGATSFVLDLRDNPGGELFEAARVASLFMEGGTVAVATTREGEERLEVTPGLFVTDAPLTVLVSENTASAAEILAGGLQDHQRALVVGELTHGKGSSQTIRTLSFGGAISYTTAAYATPDGHEIQGQGIAPDLLVAPFGSVEGRLAAGIEGDAQLVTAVEAARAWEQGGTIAIEGLSNAPGPQQEAFDQAREARRAAREGAPNPGAAPEASVAGAPSEPEPALASPDSPGDAQPALADSTEVSS